MRSSLMRNTANIQAPKEDTSMLQKQLIREISCLEMQLERLRDRGMIIDTVTLQTYQEMISARRNMLEGL